MGNAGDPWIRTPNLDALAQKSTKFTNCYCGSPLCVPSRSSLLTGLLPLDCGVMNNFQSIFCDTATFAHTVNNAGYETVLSGRMHFIGPDQFHGFEQHLVGDCTPHFHSDVHFSELYGKYVEMFKQKRETLDYSGSGYTSIQAFDKDVVRATSEYLTSRSDERPLFLTVGFISPHPPFIVEKELFDYYDNNMEDVVTDEAFRKNLHPAMQIWLEKRKITDVPAETKHRVRAAYYGLVEHMDRCIGEVLDCVKNTLDMDNTIFVYASDHGEGMGMNDMYWKTTFFEDSVKVPLMISYPGYFGEGISVSDSVSLLDLGATFNEIAGSQQLPHTYGKSLLRYCTRGSDDNLAHRAIISEIGSYPPAKDKPSAMIRKGVWKLIAYYGYEYPSLFNLDEDPKEIWDLGQDLEYEAVRKSLQEELMTIWDPDRAFAYCNSSNDHFKILKYWAEHTRHEFEPVWLPPVQCNYLENEDEKR
jgi:choline-sulfatase